MQSGDEIPCLADVNQNHSKAIQKSRPTVKEHILHTLDKQEIDVQYSMIKSGIPIFQSSHTTKKKIGI